MNSNNMRKRLLFRRNFDYVACSTNKLEHFSGHSQGAGFYCAVPTRGSSSSLLGWIQLWKMSFFDFVILSFFTAKRSAGGQRENSSFWLSSFDPQKGGAGVIPWLFSLSFTRGRKNTLPFLSLSPSLSLSWDCRKTSGHQGAANPNQVERRKKKAQPWVLGGNRLHLYSPRHQCPASTPQHHRSKMWTVWLLASDVQIVSISIVPLTKSLSSYVLAVQNSQSQLGWFIVIQLHFQGQPCASITVCL